MLLSNAGKPSLNFKKLDKVIAMGWRLVFRLCIIIVNAYLFFLFFICLGLGQFVSLFLCCLPYLFVCNLKDEL